jgi:oligopeptide transport system substrate-binding protein
MIRKQPLAVAAVAVAALVLSSCSSSGSRSAQSGSTAGSAFVGEPTGSPKQGGTFRMALATDVPSLDPALAGYDVASWSATNAVYSALVDYDTGLTLKPDLAKTWTVSPDQKTYTFHLRPGVTFSDGSPLTSADVVYSLQREIAPATASPGAYLFNDIVGATEFASGKSKTVSGLTTPDASTVVIQLQNPEPYFIKILAMPYARVMSPAQVAKYGQSISQHPLGSGPFMLQSWVPGQKLVLTRNPHYFEPGKPYLNTVEVDLNVNDQTRVLEFERGDLSITDIPAAAYTQLALDPKYNKYMVTNQDATTYFLGMKSNAKPFNNVQVRQALNYAVDKKHLVQLLNGRATVANGFVPPSLPGYDPKAKGYPYDPAKAKKMLAAAGYPNGFSSEIWTQNDDQSVRTVQSLASELAAVGVKVKVRAMNTSTFYAGVGKADQAPMFFTYWLQDYPDAYDFFSNVLRKANWGGSNMSYYYNPTVEAGIDKLAYNTTDRPAEIAALDKTVTADAPFIYLYHSISQNVHQPNVYYYIHPVHLWRFADYWVK